MTTHGRGGLLPEAMGGVTTATIESAAVPLLLVRPGVYTGDARGAGAPARAAVPPALTQNA
jgi:hypothetical protein